MAAFLPVETIGEENIAPGRVFEIKNKNTVFLIAFRELRKKDSVSPYSIERQNIRHLILNQRRLDLISDMEKEVLDRKRVVKGKSLSVRVEIGGHRRKQK